MGEPSFLGAQRRYLSSKMKAIRATKFQVLEFIERKKWVCIYDLTQRFGYSYDGAVTRLVRLKKQSLVTGMGRGWWVLTADGYRRLRWLQRRERAKSPM